MVRYLTFLSYIGSRYRGFAKQIGAERLMDIDTVEGAIETCFFNILRPRSLIRPIVQGSSRTDAGVHALRTSIHVDLEHPLKEIYDSETIIKHANIYFARCGHEIRFQSIHPVTDEFNARRNAKYREYFYRFMFAKDSIEQRIPIAEMGRSWHVRGKAIDIDALKHAIPLFYGLKNWETFAAKNRTNKEIRYVRSLMDINIEKSQSLMPQDPLSDYFHFWQINVTARSFLYNQVRRIVGALIGISSGTLTEREITTMLQVPNYKHWNTKIMTAPPQGLYLKAVHYDEEELKNLIIQNQQIEADENIKELSATV